MTEPDAKEKLAQWMIDHSFSTGHGDTIDDLLGELGFQVEELRYMDRNRGRYVPRDVRPSSFKIGRTEFGEDIW